MFVIRPLFRQSFRSLGPKQHNQNSYTKRIYNWIIRMQDVSYVFYLIRLAPIAPPLRPTIPYSQRLVGVQPAWNLRSHPCRCENASS
jgi:hypothetical protein